MAKRSGISDELIDILNEFVEEEEKTIQKVFKQTAEDTKDMIKGTSPGSGEYASGWEVKTEASGMLGGDVVYTVCNPSHCQLTHLLEKGHVVKNQFGTPTRPGRKKRTKAIRHIKPAEQWGNQELIERLRAKL